MIKRFKSNGVSGLPDCDIIFPDKKIILVQGPNGSGKSSLLRRITHPFRNLNGKSIPIRDDVNEATIEIDVNYKGEDYRIIHTSVRQKNTNKSNSYLLKYENGDYVHKIDDGGATKYNAFITDTFNYFPQQYDVLNIGVNNFGLLNLTNADRLKSLKNLLRLEMIDQLAELVGEKHRTNKNLQILLNKELGENKEDDIKVNIEEGKTKLALLRKELAKIKNTYIENISPESIEAVKTNIITLEMDLKDINKLKDILYELNTSNSFNTAKSNYDEHLLNYTAKRTSALDIIAEFTTAKNSIKILSIDELEKEKKQIIDNLTHLNKSLDEISELTNINFDTYSAEIYLRSIDNILTGIEYVDDVIYFCDNYNVKNDELIENLKKSNELKNELLDITEQLNKATYQSNIVSLIPHKLTPDDCPLKMEWSRQINNKNIYESLSTAKNKVEDNLEQLGEDIRHLQDTKTLADKILKTDKEFDNIFGTLYNNYKYLAKASPERKKIEARMTAIDFFNKRKKEKQEYENRLAKIEMDISEININNMENLSLYEKRIKTAKQELEKTNKALDKLKTLKRLFDTKFSSNKYLDNNMHQIVRFENELNEDLNLARNSLNKMVKSIDESNNREITIKNYERNILDLEVKCKMEEERLKTLQGKIEHKNQLLDESEKMKNIRDLLQNHLALKILKPFLRNVENTVNNLLGEFMSLRFEIDNGKLDMICVRDGIDRDVSVLSNGESSMLAIALLMAMKPVIPWDVISIDEGSAMLDESNKEKFIYMLTDYSNIVPDISQMFIVSHDKVIEEGMDIFKIQIVDGKIVY